MGDVGITDVPPDPVDLEALHHVAYTGVSAALLPNGSLLCGAAATAMVLSRSQADGRGGLILVHSHRQRNEDYRAHARALGLEQSNTVSSIVDGASLLLINNNAPLLYQRASFGRSVHWGPLADDAIGWLRAYGGLPLHLRLLITTSLNCGYFCGELQALAAVATITSRFEWVLTFSGPDVLPTPYGLSRLSSLLLSPAPSGSQPPSFLYEPFPAQRAHFRVSMDIFVYRPAQFGQHSGQQQILRRPGMEVGSTWSLATDLCLRATNRIPETIVAEVLLARNVTRQRISERHTRATTWTTKLSVSSPPTNAVVWHVHNESARSMWLTAEEQQRGRGARHYDIALRRSADWPSRHAVCRTPLGRARNRLPSRRWGAGD
jgi:hypothetical protein